MDSNLIKQNVLKLQNANASPEDIETYVKSASAQVAPSSPAAPVTSANNEDSGGGLGGVVKSIVSAPATIIARPIQAVAELAGVSPEDVDKYSSKFSGGLVAPVPQNAGDVEKDIGRGAETVALGLNPVAGGALFGAGNSLEQGNNLFSGQTAFDTVLGAAGGKVLDTIGKPIFNAAGKIIGKVTPEFLNGVAAQGTKAIQDFAAAHDILPENISKGINNAAEKVNAAANLPFDAARNAIKGPAATPEEQAAIKDAAHLNKVVDLTRDDFNSGVTAQNGKKIVKGEGTAGQYASGSGVTTGFRGVSGVEPTAEDLARAQAVKHLIDPNDVNGSINRVNQSVKETSNARDTFLDKNNVPTNFQEFHDYIQNWKLPETLTNDPAAKGAYQDMKDRAIELRTKYPWTLKGTQQARIAVDHMIENELGETSLGDPKEKGIKNAARDLRNAFNQFNEDSLRYGDIRKVNQANKDFNAFRKRGIGVTADQNAEMSPEKLKEALFKNRGLEVAPENELKANEFRRWNHNIQQKIETARNLGIRANAEKGTTRTGRFFKKNPAAKTAAKVGSKATGLGALYEAAHSVVE